MLATLAKKYAPVKPFAGPLYVEFQFAVVPPKRWTEAKRADAFRGLLHPMGRPDWDNYGKLASDALNGLFWNDDAQLVDVRVRKLYRPSAAIHVYIREV